MRLFNDLDEFRFTPRKFWAWLSRSFCSLWLYLALSFRARTTSASIRSATSDAVINLTSHGKRIKRVHLAIESIARGHMLPGRIILWLDDEDWDAGGRERAIRRLARRGLEVRKGSRKFRAHNKYINFAWSSEEGVIVTADDDVFYPRNWLSALWRSFEEGGRNDVVAHWVRHPRVVADRITPSRDWSDARDTKPRIGSFSLGVAGVVFPASLRESLTEAGATFMEKSALADDVWISWNALRAGIPVRQCTESPLSVLVIPFTQKHQLAHENILNKQNDHQILATYRRVDVERIESGELP